ncbi:MAG: D-2-hydroxyacid dehydrogenase [Xanthomonadales bacterium]
MFKIIFTAVLILAPAVGFTDPPDQVRDAIQESAVEVMIRELGLRQSPLPSRDLSGWKPPRKIVAMLDTPDRLPGLEAAAPGVEIVVVKTVDEAVERAQDAQIVLGFCDDAFFSAAQQLHWIQLYSAGVDRCMTHAGIHTGNKLLTNGQRIASPALAEHAIAMMLVLVRGLDIYHANQIKGVWQRETELNRTDHLELAGRTLLVVGLGGIGTQTARRAHALGMRVIATRGSRREGPDYVEYVGLSDELNHLAAQADVVINTAPLTDRTRGMFDATFFQAMRPQAFFISVGRGASTVTDDLVSALEKGSIAGAGLDVTDPEPLPEGHPLWTMPRVIISPHVAGRSDRSRDRLYLLVQENLRRYVAGEPMLSVVDIERGY